MKNVGEELRLNEATVRSWCEARPRNMMKYLPEISKQCEATFRGDRRRSHGTR